MDPAEPNTASGQYDLSFMLTGIETSTPTKHHCERFYQALHQNKDQQHSPCNCQSEFCRRSPHWIFEKTCVRYCVQPQLSVAVSQVADPGFRILAGPDRLSSSRVLQTARSMDKPAVVIDNGTGYVLCLYLHAQSDAFISYTKMGFAGGVAPSYIVPTAVATRSDLRAGQVPKGLDSLDYHVGFDVGRLGLCCFLH